MPDEITIKSVDKPYGTPLMKLLAAAVNELYREGYGRKAVSTPSYQDEAFYAEIDGQIAGVLCWSISEWRKEAWIDMAYVKPGFRRLGVYSLLYQALYNESKKRKLRSIAGGVDVNNEAIIAAAKAQGRVAESVVYRYTFPFESEEVESEVKDANV